MNERPVVRVAAGIVAAVVILTGCVPEPAPAQPQALAPVVVPMPRPTRTPVASVLSGGSILFVGNSFTAGFGEPAASFNSRGIVDANAVGTGVWRGSSRG